MSPRTGRPLKGDTKRDMRLQLRISDEEIALIEECAERLHTTRVDVVVKGVEMVKEELDAKEK